MKFSHALISGAALLSLTACSTIGLGGAPSLPSPSSILLDGVDLPVVSANLPVAQLSTSNPICLKFYENTANFAAIPTAALGVDLPSVPGVPGLPGVPSLPDVPEIPKGPSFGSSLIKTLVLGTLSGVAGGGISALGIESKFLESALIGTATQVTYNTGETVYDSILGDKAPDPSTPEGQAAIAAAAAAEAHDVGSHTHAANGEVIVHSPAAASAATAATTTPTHMAAIQAAASQLGCPAPDASAIAALKLIK